MSKAKHDPSEAEIKRECEKIQATWTPAERRKRAGRDDERVEVEVVKAADLFGERNRGER